MSTPDKRNTKFTVKLLGHHWGVRAEYIQFILRKAKQSKQGFKHNPIRRVKMIDDKTVHELFVQCLKRQVRRRTSVEALTARFNKLHLGKDVGSSSIARWLKHVKARKVKRVMVQQLSPGNIHARFLMASENKDNRWNHHFDLDEKWFYVATGNGWCWVSDDVMTKADIELIKNIPVRSKRYITKVMYLTVVSRPIVELDFDGKLYITRCSRPYKAKRPSKYHNKGDIYEKDCNVTGKFFLEKCKEVMAAITELYKDWDVTAHGPLPTVTVQIDGAGPHRAQWVEDELNRLGHENVPHIVWWRQAAQCPQSNMNDLAVYNHLAAEAARHDYSNAAELNQAVMDAWDSMSPVLLERVAAVKCVVMHELIKARGKVIKIPSSGIRSAQALGCLWQLIDEICA